MPSKWKWVIIGSLIGLLLSGSVFASGFAVGAYVGSNGAAWLKNLPPQIGEHIPLNPESHSDQPPQDAETLFKPFWEAWDIIHEQFVDQPVDDVKLMQGAISGAIEALGDPHSSYMDPDTYLQANIPLQGSYEGIGAWVDTDSEYLTIISPMPGSPAEAAGLLPGDEVIAVDGEDVTGLDPNIVVRRVMGPAGSTVVLTIRREGEREPLEFSVVREAITIPSVSSKLLDDHIGYIQLFSFASDTASDLRDAIRDLDDQGMEALILDLRGNGGGFLNSAVDVASEFISEGVILTERFGDGTEQEYTATGKGLATDLSLVVLIDGGSASASEIVAGAIQDYGRGTLVGETSFGKGSVQNWIPLEDNQGAVRITIARWYTPDGRQIQGQGLTPDVAVETTDDDLASERDPQLEKALELLKGS